VVYFHSSSPRVENKIEKQYFSSPSNSFSHSHFATVAFHTVTLQKIKKPFPTCVFTHLFKFFFFFFFSHFAQFFLSFPSLFVSFSFSTQNPFPQNHATRLKIWLWVRDCCGGGGWLEFLQWLGWCSCRCFGFSGCGFAVVLAVVGLVFHRVFWIFWVWVCWSSCSGWVGVPSGVWLGFARRSRPGCGGLRRSQRGDGVVGVIEPWVWLWGCQS
jgi:hypothetical protein